MTTIDRLAYRSGDRFSRDERHAIDLTNVHQLEAEFAYFADCVLTSREPEPDGEHGLADMQAIEAIYESAETGETVEVRT